MAEDVSGLPTTADIVDIVVREGVWVAVGAVQGRRVASEPFDLGIWRSSDGLAWREAYRTRSHGDQSTTGQVIVTADGFAVVGTACRNQTCTPMALLSADGRKWHSAARPPVGLDVRGSPRGAVSDVAGLPDASGRPGPDLVAVGYASFQRWGNTRDARPVVWRSGDSGRTWEADSPTLSGVAHVYPLDQVEAVGRTLVAHSSEEGADHMAHDVLWRSEDGGRQWARLPVPDAVDASSMRVTGRPRGALLLIGHRPSGEPALWRSEDLVRWTETTTVPAREGSLLDTGEGLVFGRAGLGRRLVLWGSRPGATRFERTYAFGPKEQPAIEGMVTLDHRSYVYAAAGMPGTRGFVRLAAGIPCAVARCPEAPALPLEAVGLTGYRAEPVPVVYGRQRVLVANGGGGEGWSDVTPERLLGSANESVGDVEFLHRDHGWLVVVNVEDLGSWVLRTTDGGRSWTTTSYRGEFSMHAGTSLEVTAVDADHAWTAYVVPPASGHPLVARTTDGGQTWSESPESVPIAGEIRFTDALHGFSADNFGFDARGFFTTDDGGETWREGAVPLPAGVTPQQTRYGLPRFFGHRAILPVGILEPARSRVAFYVSDDKGATWRKAAITDVPPGTWNVQAAVAGLQTWWAADAGASVVSVTADAGRTWTERRPSGTAGAVRIVHASDAETAVAAQWDGSTASLLATHDGGATWGPFLAPEAPPAGQPRSCANAGPATVPARAGHLTVARGDLDGDGHADRLVFYTVHPGGRDFDDWRMRAELADGTVIDVTGDDQWRSRERPLGALDLNGDGRQEIFVAIDGVDSAFLGAIVLAGCELKALFAYAPVRYDKKEQPERGTAGVVCTDVDGDGHPEIVETRTGPEAGTWSYTAYRIAGGYALTVRSATGQAGDTRPATIRFGPGFRCDGLSS